MGGEWFVLGLVLLVITTGVGLLYVRLILPRMLSYGPLGTVERVNTFTDDADDYDEYDAEGDAPEVTSATAVARNPQPERNGSAITPDDDNAGLTRNPVLRARAEVIARLVKAGTLYIPDGKGGFKPAGQIAIIRTATGLEPNGRPESDYGRLKAELDALLAPTFTVNAGRPDERIVAK